MRWLTFHCILVPLCQISHVKYKIFHLQMFYVSQRPNTMHHIWGMCYMQVMLMHLPLNQSVPSATILFNEIHALFFLISGQNVASEKLRIRERWELHGLNQIRNYAPDDDLWNVQWSKTAQDTSLESTYIKTIYMNISKENQLLILIINVHGKTF